uniref:Uncharacterized protein n=1 Tax=Magallana gigas TaxID=29159 RepID=K1R085_MAGGI
MNIVGRWLENLDPVMLDASYGSKVCGESVVPVYKKNWSSGKRTFPGSVGKAQEAAIGSTTSGEKMGLNFNQDNQERGFTN